MADSIRKIRTAELSRITGVSRSTRASWVERGAVEEPRDGVYEERHVVETAIFALLTAKVETSLAEAAWLDARSTVLGAALRGAPSKHRRLDLLVNAQTAALDLVSSNNEIGKIALQNSGEPHIVIPLARSVNGVRAGYWRYARLNPAGKRKRRSTKVGRKMQSKPA